MLCNSNGSIDQNSVGYQMLSIRSPRTNNVIEQIYEISIGIYANWRRIAHGVRIVQNISLSARLYAGDVGANAAQRAAQVGAISSNRIQRTLQKKNHMDNSRNIQAAALTTGINIWKNCIVKKTGFSIRKIILGHPLFQQCWIDKQFKLTINKI